MFGAAFVLQGLLLFVYGTKLEFEPQHNLHTRIGLLFVVFALVLYPLLGLLNHPYPAGPVFPLPCPLVIFTFGVLVLSKKSGLVVTVVPLLWAFVGITAAFRLGVYQDVALPIAAVSSIVLIYYRERKKNR